ncbi:MAG TPA: amidohydrolase family protein [Pseudolabrys sp.]|nr:amidohydrolase family protein [Pseudolabrys sp.]
MRALIAWPAFVATLLTGALSAPAQERIEIFDAHLHYNQEPKPFYSLDQVRDVFRRNGIMGIIATSRPNKGTHELVDAKWPELKVVPFIRPYRVRSDIQTWFNDPEIFELIKNEYARGYFRGIGEFHIYGKAAESGWVKKMVDFAVERNLFLHAHCDEEALLILFRHNPKARIIWAHTGFSVPPARLAELLDQHKDALWGELSYRGGIAGSDGKLTSDWRNLFARYSDRFLLGSDTWINERWFGYDTIFKEYRGWLAELPADQAQRIASGNAMRLFGLRRE